LPWEVTTTTITPPPPAAAGGGGERSGSGKGETAGQGRGGGYRRHIAGSARRNDQLLAAVKGEETMVMAITTGMATCRGGEMREDTKSGGGRQQWPMLVSCVALTCRGCAPQGSDDNRSLCQDSAISLTCFNNGSN
jgi:hypothetical protein